MGVFTAKIQQCNAVCLLGTKTVSYLSVGAGSSFQEGGSSHDGEGQTAWTCGGAQQDTGTSGNACKQHNTQFKHLHTHNLFHNHFFPSPPRPPPHSFSHWEGVFQTGSWALHVMSFIRGFFCGVCDLCSSLSAGVPGLELWLCRELSCLGIHAYQYFLST